MSKSEVLQLVAVSRNRDALGQFVETELPGREVYASVKSVTRAEWAAVDRQGLKPAACVKIWADEYQGELIAILNGQRYGVYRTYQCKSDEIELYLEKKGGV